MPENNGSTVRRALNSRSQEITRGIERSPNRSMLRAVGLTDDDFDKPLIGVASTWNEITPCNSHINRLAEKVKEGAVEKNLTRAVAYHEAALASLNQNKDISPRIWATIQINLGDTYLHYGNKDQGNYRELARACYRDALSIYTIDSYPKEWADIHVRLATIYQGSSEEHQQERDLLLRCAIVCSEAALLVYSPDSFPFEYAETLVSQGHLHTIRTEGNQIFNLEQACKCYRKALRIFTRQDFPEACNLVLNNLRDVESKREALSQQVKGFTPASTRV